MDDDKLSQTDGAGALQPIEQFNGSNENGTALQVCTDNSSSINDRSNSSNDIFNSEIPQFSGNVTNQGNNETWNTVQSEKQNKKRGREGTLSPPKRQKQPKITYWLDDPGRQNQNRFSVLEVDAPDVPKEIVHKPPPIFVDKVINIQPLIKILNENISDKYEIKVLKHDRIKIQPKLPEAFSKIVKILEEKNTEFYTYKLKEERNFKVVLRNMHYSSDTEDIKDELNRLGHKVVNIWNIKHRQNKNPLSLFTIELEPRENNKDIYKVKGLLHTRVVFEPPRPKREMPQCSNCQHYGHTKAYCHRTPTCIKCAGNHKSVLCPRKTRSNDVKCALCKGQHPANYKGCEMYKKLHRLNNPMLTQNRNVNFRQSSDTRSTVSENIAVRQSSDTFPPVSGRQLRQSRDTSSTVSTRQFTGTSSSVPARQSSDTFSSVSVNQLGQSSGTSSSVPRQSYANTARGRAATQTPLNTNTVPRNAFVPVSENPQDTSFASEIREMMSFMRQMMQQLSAMTTLLINLTSKLSANSIP